MNKQEEKDLLRMYLLEDSQEAFQRLIERYSLQIKRMINFRIEDPNEQRELFEDTVADIAEKLKISYEGKGSFATWLSKVVMNRINTYFRVRARAFFESGVNEFTEEGIE